MSLITKEELYYAGKLIDSLARMHRALSDCLQENERLRAELEATKPKESTESEAAHDRA